MSKNNEDKNQEDIFPFHQIPALPWLPIPDDSVSKHVEAVFNNSRYPPLMREESWTRAVPFKDCFKYSKPKDRIGATFSIPSTKLHFENMPSARAKVIPTGVMDAKGNLLYPPQSDLNPSENARVRSKKLAAERHQPGVVNLWDVLTGEYHRKRREKRQQEKLARQEKLRLLAIEKAEKLKEEQRKLQNMEAECPLDPDEQKVILLNQIEKEIDIKILPTDVERILYYISQGIDIDMIEPYSNKPFMKALKKFPKNVKIKHADCIDKMKKEISDNYFTSIKKSILQYILLDNKEKERLKIHNYPIKYPGAVLRSPVPWHASFVKSKERISYNLFNSHPVLLALRRLWMRRYKDLVIVPLNVLKMKGLPMDPVEFDKITTALCDKAQNILLDNWLLEASEIILQLRHTWEHLAPKNKTDSSLLLETFFSNINTLIALQIREILMNSVKHYHWILLRYKDGNQILDGYTDHKFPRCPLLTMYVHPDETGGALVSLQPSIKEIKNLLISVVPKILRISKEVPSLEQYLFQDLQGTPTYLSAVRTYEKEVTKIIESISEIHFANSPGPDQYLFMYDDYNYILSGAADTELHKFFQIIPFPILKVNFKDRYMSIDYYKLIVCVLNLKYVVDKTEWTEKILVKRKSEQKGEA